VPKNSAAHPKLARRNKLILQLMQQRALAKDETYTVKRQKWVKQEDGSKQLVESPKRVKRWWRMDGAGGCFLTLRYGNKIISPSLRCWMPSSPQRRPVSLMRRSKPQRVTIRSPSGRRLDHAAGCARARAVHRNIKVV